MKRPPIGSFRHRLALEEPTTTTDDGGGFTTAWTALGDVWAAVAPVSGDERLVADALSGRLTHRITERQRRDVKPAMRLRTADRIYEIVAVLDAYPLQPLVCLCEERHL